MQQEIRSQHDGTGRQHWRQESEAYPSRCAELRFAACILRPEGYNVPFFWRNQTLRQAGNLRVRVFIDGLEWAATVAGNAACLIEHDLWRIEYFLWGTCPERLLRAAYKNVSNPAVLRWT